MTTILWKLINNEIAYAVLGALVGATGAWLYTRWKFNRARKAFHSGELPHEVVVVATTLEPRSDGFFMLKPRTVEAAYPLRQAFPNDVLAAQVVKATQRCNTEAVSDSFVVLPDQKMHNVFMKHVVDIASELGAAGHILRMCDQKVINNDCYVCVTYAVDGFHKRIRIDLISEENLRRFLDADFEAHLQQREDEGSHADLIELFSICAQKRFSESGDDDRAYVRRVSIPVAST